jgi:hypothetical protein
VTILAWYSDSGHRDQVNVGWILIGLSIFFLLWFVAALRRAISVGDRDGLLTSGRHDRRSRLRRARDRAERRHPDDERSTPMVFACSLTFNLPAALIKLTLT